MTGDKINSSVTRKQINDCWCTSISKALNDLEVKDNEYTK